MESSVRPFSFRAELIKSASLIAWDELPAANVAWLDCVHRLCQTIMQNDKPFGGIPFLGVGDFRQVAPVVKGSGCTPAKLACVKSSTVWTQFVLLSLHAPIWSARDPSYTAFVDRIGEDYVHPSVSLDLLATVPSVNDCIDFLYPPDVLLDPLACLKRAFLSPKNIPVDDFNIKVLDRLPGEERTLLSTVLLLLFLTFRLQSVDMFYSADSIKEDSDAPEDELRADFLAVLTHTGVPPHLLRLKRGCVCSIMRNLSVRKGLVKNARVIVHSLHRLFVQVQVINNRDGSLGTVHCIPRIRFEFNPPYSSWTIRRLQFPLRLAYACTFNGCVGLTLDKAVLDQRSPVFAHGQLYTALSRVRSREDCRVLFNEGDGPETENVVYRELLL